jgi:hypothetical protein
LKNFQTNLAVEAKKIVISKYRKLMLTDYYHDTFDKEQGQSQMSHVLPQKFITCVCQKTLNIVILKKTEMTKLLISKIGKQKKRSRQKNNKKMRFFGCLF